MAQIDFTVADIEQFKLPYAEGMAVTEELSKKVEGIYHHFHEKFLSLENEARADEHLSYALFSFDTALEAFSIVAKNMVRSGKMALILLVFIMNIKIITRHLDIYCIEGRQNE